MLRKIITISIFLIIIAVVITIVILKLKHEFFIPTNSPLQTGLTAYTCDSVPLNDATKKVFTENSVQMVKSRDAQLYIPCGYNEVGTELGLLPANKKQMVMGIKDCDRLVAKDGLWTILKKFYGNQASEIMPTSYNLYDTQDVEDFMNVPKDTVCILKKNIQRQEGLKLVKRQEILSKDQLKRYLDESFATIQIFQDYPLIVANGKAIPCPIGKRVDGKKTNFRIYLLIVYSEAGKKAYIYDDGFIYYTKKNYLYSTDPDQVITSGYVPRSFYQSNPLTIKDLYATMSSSNADTLKNNIQNTIKLVSTAAFSFLPRDPRRNVEFQLFGVDIQAASDLSTKIIEVNKGPSLSEHDSRDAALKLAMQKEMYAVVGIGKRQETFMEL